MSMKKLLFVAVAIAIVLGTFASAIVVPVQSSQQIEAADTTLHSSLDSNLIKISYDFPSPTISTAPSELSEGYMTVTMDGLPQCTEEGLPVLPFRTAQILLPQGKEIASIAVTCGDKVTLPGSYLIEPGQKALPLNYEGTIEPTAANTSVYDSMEPYPCSLYSNVMNQSKAGYHIFLVNLNPMEYIPQARQLSYYENMTVTLTLRVATAVNSQLCGFRGLTSDKESAENLVDNPAMANSYTTVSKVAESSLLSSANSDSSLLDSVNYEYVIITNENLSETPGPYNFQALRDSKIAQGMTATIVTTEWIYANYNGTRPHGGEDNQTKIRNFIIDAYNNWGTTYVLLGGDGDNPDIDGPTGDNIIPARLLWSCFETYAVPIAADMYYACLDGTFDYNGDGYYGVVGLGLGDDGPGGGEVDLFAEVYVGRAPVATPEQVSNFVRKTLAYQNISSDDVNLRKVWMVGEYLGFGGVSDWGCNYKDEIKEGSDAYGYTTIGFDNSNRSLSYDVHTLYDRDWQENGWPEPDYRSGGWPNTSIIGIINDNVHLINAAGHADIDNVMKMYNPDADNLSNNELYFIGYSWGCQAGAFDAGGNQSDSIVEHLITGAHGAVAFIANSRYGWGAIDGTIDGPSQHFDREFWDAVLGEGITTIGIANQDSKEDNAGRVYGSPFCNRDRFCYYEINLFGDPALNIKFYHPDLTVSSNTGGSVTTPGEGTFGPYEPGEVVDLVATPDVCYHFVNWTGSGVDAGKVANPYSPTTTILMDYSYSVQANFAINWALMNSGTNQGLQGVWGTSSSDVYAVGGGGTILHYYGSEWGPMTSGTTKLLYGVWGTSSSDIFAMGYGGTIRHYNGNIWGPMTSGTTKALFGVWGASPSDVYAVGNNLLSGIILHYNGVTWSPTNTQACLFGVWGTSSSNIYAVGTLGTILHYNGNSWSPMASGTNRGLTGIWGTSSSDIFAVGSSGTILHYDDVYGWSTMTSGTTSNLYGVGGTSSHDVYAVGDNGTILHYNGNEWSAMTSCTTTHLRGVWGDSSTGDIFIVGSGGTILRKG